MAKLQALLFACIILCLVSAPSRAQVNWGAMSLRLSENMTEQQVINAIGYSPSKAELKTCGQRSATGSWDCKIFTYGGGSTFLLVYMHRSGNSWIVNGWTVYP
jgi:hypothetical protein